MDHLRCLDRINRPIDSPLSSLTSQLSSRFVECASEFRQMPMRNANTNFVAGSLKSPRTGKSREGMSERCTLSTSLRRSESIERDLFRLKFALEMETSATKALFTRLRTAVFFQALSVRPRSRSMTICEGRAAVRTTEAACATLQTRNPTQDTG